MGFVSAACVEINGCKINRNNGKKYMSFKDVEEVDISGIYVNGKRFKRKNQGHPLVSIENVKQLSIK